MEFPQYLWRIGVYEHPWMVRRGNDCNEPIEKCLRKDHPKYIIGVMSYCGIFDAIIYSRGHDWDWMNS